MPAVTSLSQAPDEVTGGSTNLNRRQQGSAADGSAPAPAAPQAESGRTTQIIYWIFAGLVIAIAIGFGVAVWWWNRRKRRLRATARVNAARIHRLTGNDSQPRDPTGTAFTEPAVELQDLPSHVHAGAGRPPGLVVPERIRAPDRLHVPGRAPTEDIHGRTRLPPPAPRAPGLASPPPVVRALNPPTTPPRVVPSSAHALQTTPTRAPNVAATVAAAPGAPIPDSPLRQKVERAQLRRLAAAREAELRDAAARGELRRTNAAMRVATVDEEDEPTDPLHQAALDTYALDDTVSRSDDSHMDIHRRGPSMNPAFQAARQERYQQRLAHGWSPEHAMSVSDGSTEVSDGPGPLTVLDDSTNMHQPAPRATRRLPSVSSGAAIGAAPLTATRHAAVQFAPARIPDRWQPQPLRHPDHYTNFSRVGGVGLSSEPAETVILREPGPSPPPRDEPSPFDPVGIAWTEAETEETGTGTGTGTVISDDPWLEEVLANRRRAHRS